MSPRTSVASHRARFATLEHVERRVCAVAWPRLGAEQWERYLPEVPYEPVCP